MSELITLSQFKILKGITTSEFDSQFELLIEMVSDFVQEYCHRTFGQGIFTEKKEGVIDYNGYYYFRVANAPLSEVISIDIKFLGVTDSLSVNIDYLDVFEEEGYAYYAHTFSPLIGVIRPHLLDKFNYTITYSGGSAVPGPVRLATANIVSDTWEYRRKSNSVNASGESNPELKSIKIGDYSETYSTGNEDIFYGFNKDSGFIMNKSNQDLLRSFVAEGQSW